MNHNGPSYGPGLCEVRIFELNYLILSGLWIAWRHRFSTTGIVLGLIASVLGILFFAPYLLFVSILADGDTKKIVLGENPT